MTTTAKILSIDTSCDETSCSVTADTTVLSNVIWSQASLHAKWGGVYPSSARRAHREHIDYVVKNALLKAHITPDGLDAIAVTQGPGLAISLEVGIEKAKNLATTLKLPLIPINHVEGHLLSPLAQNKKIPFPALGFVASGGTTAIILAKKIGDYKVLAKTGDDALGEALDKGARMLGLGYPGGAILEGIAKEGNPASYSLPVPMAGREKELSFSYSGIKTAMWRLVESQKPLTKEKIHNLAASYQDRVFKHVENLVAFALSQNPTPSFLFGGGVSSNLELRKRIRKICHRTGTVLYLPYSKKLCTDNAAMIGVAAYFKFKKKEYLRGKEMEKIERLPRWKIDLPAQLI